jgi:hypothetical protein
MSVEVVEASAHGTRAGRIPSRSPLLLPTLKDVFLCLAGTL